MYPSTGAKRARPSAVGHSGGYQSTASSAASSENGPSTRRDLAELSIRIMALDSYQSHPQSPFDTVYSTQHGTVFEEVPVLRVYGTTPSGQKVTCHVHNVWPYFFVACRSLTNRITTVEAALNSPSILSHCQSLATALGLALERALQLAADGGGGGGGVDAAAADVSNTNTANNINQRPRFAYSRRKIRTQYIASTEVVRGKAFYGYYKDDEIFIKVSLVNNRDLAKTLALLRSGAILGTPIENMQFLVDYNLFGCDFMHLSNVHYRQLRPADAPPRAAPRLCVCALRPRLAPLRATASLLFRHDGVPRERDVVAACAACSCVRQVHDFRTPPESPAVRTAAVPLNYNRIILSSNEDNNNNNNNNNNNSRANSGNDSSLSQRTPLRSLHSFSFDARRTPRVAASPLEATSSCELEIDCTAADIMNAQHKFSFDSTVDERARHVASLVPQIGKLWDDERRRAAAAGASPPASATTVHFQPRRRNENVIVADNSDEQQQSLSSPPIEKPRLPYDEDSDIGKRIAEFFDDVLAKDARFLVQRGNEEDNVDAENNVDDNKNAAILTSKAVAVNKSTETGAKSNRQAAMQEQRAQHPSSSRINSPQAFAHAALLPALASSTPSRPSPALSQAPHVYSQRANKRSDRKANDDDTEGDYKNDNNEKRTTFDVATASEDIEIETIEPFFDERLALSLSQVSSARRASRAARRRSLLASQSQALASAYSTPAAGGKRRNTNSLAAEAVATTAQTSGFSSRAALRTDDVAVARGVGPRSPRDGAPSVATAGNIDNDEYGNLSGSLSAPPTPATQELIDILETMRDEDGEDLNSEESEINAVDASAASASKSATRTVRSASGDNSVGNVDSVDNEDSEDDEIHEFDDIMESQAFVAEQLLRESARRESPLESSTSASGGKRRRRDSNDAKNDTEEDMGANEFVINTTSADESTHKRDLEMSQWRRHLDNTNVLPSPSPPAVPNVAPAASATASAVSFAQASNDFSSKKSNAYELESVKYTFDSDALALEEAADSLMQSTLMSAPAALSPPPTSDARRRAVDYVEEDGVVFAKPRLPALSTRRLSSSSAVKRPAALSLHATQPDRAATALATTSSSATASFQASSSASNRKRVRFSPRVELIAPDSKPVASAANTPNTTTATKSPQSPLTPPQPPATFAPRECKSDWEKMELRLSLTPPDSPTSPRIQQGQRMPPPHNDRQPPSPLLPFRRPTPPQTQALIHSPQAGPIVHSVSNQTRLLQSSFALSANNLDSERNHTNQVSSHDHRRHVCYTLRFSPPPPTIAAMTAAAQSSDNNDNKIESVASYFGQRPFYRHTDEDASNPRIRNAFAHTRFDIPSTSVLKEAKAATDTGIGKEAKMAAEAAARSKVENTHSPFTLSPALPPPPVHLIAREVHERQQHVSSAPSLLSSTLNSNDARTPSCAPPRVSMITPSILRTGSRATSASKINSSPKLYEANVAPPPLVAPLAHARHARFAHTLRADASNASIVSASALRALDADELASEGATLVEADCGDELRAKRHAQFDSATVCTLWTQARAVADARRAATLKRTLPDDEGVAHFGTLASSLSGLDDTNPLVAALTTEATSSAVVGLANVASVDGDIDGDSALTTAAEATVVATADERTQAARVASRAQLDAPPPPPQNAHAFAMPQAAPRSGAYDALDADPSRCLNLTILSVSVQAVSRGSLWPNPQYDEICMIAWTLHDQHALLKQGAEKYRDAHGLFIVLPTSARDAACPPYASSSADSSSAAATAEATRNADVANRTENEANQCNENRSLQQDNDENNNNHNEEDSETFASDLHARARRLLRVGADTALYVCDNEVELFVAFVNFVRCTDPDILCGWDVQMGSIGYILERAQACAALVERFERGLANELARSACARNTFSEEDDDFGFKHAAGVNLSGRVCMNAWRVVRAELALAVYSFENCVYHILHQRVAHYEPRTRTEWMQSPLHLHRAVSACLQESMLTMRILHQLDIFAKTAELATLFGCMFSDVLVRGSQFRVESMMMRLTKVFNYVCATPSKQQVANQRAPECVALIAEPDSRFYSDPVVVLDFASLYPSVMIAYNLCFSTCLGKMQDYKQATAADDEAEAAAAAAATDSQGEKKIDNTSKEDNNNKKDDGNEKKGNRDLSENNAQPAALKPNTTKNSKGVYAADDEDAYTNTAEYQVGAMNYRMKRGTIAALAENDQLFVAPTGAMFVTADNRRGVLPRMVDELLAARQMVKKALKRASAQNEVALERSLNSKQLGLKLIANVTYGYTSASYSGRMPMVELADAIVQCGRVILERAIRTVNSHAQWGARVVYGDTDSLFVLLRGKTRQEAHSIGADIARTITASNASPVRLKMEKVYLPCILQTKKRYVGYAYESASQVAPVFDAKGIETVRRDVCPAVASVLEETLHVLFQSRDLSLVKAYVRAQAKRLLEQRASLRALTFAREVRLGSYSTRGPPPPAALVAYKDAAADPRRAPRHGERVRFVVVAGAPGARLVDIVVPPRTYVANQHAGMRLNVHYYLYKQIVPALQRVLALVGVDVSQWLSRVAPPVGARTWWRGVAQARAAAAAAATDAARRSAAVISILSASQTTVAAANAAAVNESGVSGVRGEPSATQIARDTPVLARRGMLHGKQATRTLDDFYSSNACALCMREVTVSLSDFGGGGSRRAARVGQRRGDSDAFWKRVVCESCRTNEAAAYLALFTRYSALAHSVDSTRRICSQCTTRVEGAASDGSLCTSQDCDVFHVRNNTEAILIDIESILD